MAHLCPDPVRLKLDLFRKAIFMNKNFTIFSAMPQLLWPGPAQLIRERGWRVEFIVDVQKQVLLPEEIASALLKRAPEMEYLIADITPLTREFFVRAEKLRLASMYGVGLNHIDIQAATEHGVVVTNAKGANAQSTAELAIAHIFALARKLPQVQQDITNGVWLCRVGREVFGKTLGIAGFGDIGSLVARMGKALGLRVLFHNRSPKPELAAEIGAEQVTLDELLAQADYLSINLPALPGDKPFITAAEIAKMKPTACIINTGRGSLIDLNALTEALSTGKLGGAGLDVYPLEPLTLSFMESLYHPLHKLPNVSLTPHAGSATCESAVNVTRMCLDEVERRRRGEPSPNCRNPEVYARLK